MRRLLLLCLTWTLGLSGCGGGGDVDSGGGGGGSGWVSIGSPAPPQAETELVAVSLSGAAFISPTRRVCCTGSATDTGVSVAWSNTTTGASGPANQSISYCWFLMQFPCQHTWRAEIPLNLGSNSIAVTASDGDENFATATIVIIRNMDLTPPIVSSTSPADQAAGVPIDASLTATFNEHMDPGSVNEATFVLRDAGMNVVPATVTYVEGERTATLDPAGNLASGTVYTARITTGARDLAGNNALATERAWSFATGTALWQGTATNGAPSYAAPPTAVWTGSEMILWGATASDRAGARYDPDTDIWRSVESSGAPSRRSSHFAVWTGREMIVWGGLASAGWVNDGVRYDPLADRWLSLPTLNAPSPRMGATAVWTGTEMIIWGGQDVATLADLNDGARYNPATNSWQPVGTTGAPSGRSGHTVVWTGSEMIVWGGISAAAWTSTGGRYSPASNSWQPTAGTDAPAARNNHAAVWTGTRMVVWGGTAGTVGNPPLNSGGRYDPATNTWQVTATAGAPDAAVGFSAVASGSSMMLWGGISSASSTPVDTGAIYNPATNQWSAIAATGAPAARSGHVAVWSGAAMVVWGPLVNTGGRYTP